jgi:hypothetical protein
MLQYEQTAGSTIDGWELQYQQIPKIHRELLHHLPQKVERAREAVKKNAQLLAAIVQDGEATQAIGPALTAANSHFRRTHGRVDSMDAGKARFSPT